MIQEKQLYVVTWTREFLEAPAREMHLQKLLEPVKTDDYY